MSKNPSLAGLLVALLVIVCASATGAGVALYRVQVDGIPQPRQLVHLGVADMPYQVPADHRLVVTGIGIAVPDSYGKYSYAKGTLGIDGVPAAYYAGGSANGIPTWYGENFLEYSTGIPADAGQTVTLSGSLFLVGYLAPL
jgi:hypothetical protein